MHQTCILLLKENSDMDDEDTETDEEEQPSYETNGPDSTQHQSPPAVPVNRCRHISTNTNPFKNYSKYILLNVNIL